MKFHAPVSGDTALPLPLGLAHFVPWFTIDPDTYPLDATLAKTIPSTPPLEPMRHWQDSRAGYRRTHLHLPEIGVYDSRDPHVIHWQIETALAFGITGFIVNWYGQNSVENVITLHWLSALDTWNREHPDKPFHYVISIDSQAQMTTEGKSPVPMEQDFAYIRDHLLGDASLRRDGKPVFVVFPYERNTAAWREAIDHVFGPQGADLIWMNETPGDGEDAAYPWVRPDEETVDLSNTHPWFDPDNTGNDWLRDFYRKANATSARPSYIMGGVWPGFDDQLVTWAWNPTADERHLKPRVICRESTRGNTLERTWETYLEYLDRWATGDADAAVPAPLVQIITWNDYAEASTVEPTRDYGTRPLETCRQMLMEARKIWASKKPSC